MYCPECRSEYREGIERCAHCECQLVVTLPEPCEDKQERLRRAVAAGEAVQIAKARYREATQMVETIQAAGVDAMLMGDEASLGQPGRGCCGGPAFFVAVLPEDVEGAIEALRAAHRALAASDEEVSLEAMEAMVDLDAEGEKCCPACGASFDGAPEECPDCGLYLGAQ